MGRFIKIIKLYFLQFLLAIVATLAFAEVEDIGHRSKTEVGTYETVNHNDKSFGGEYNTIEGTSVALSTGFPASALSMGLICSVCIVMIVWIEIKKDN